MACRRPNNETDRRVDHLCTDEPRSSRPSRFSRLRGPTPSPAAGDSAYVTLGEHVVGLTGFAPGAWEWHNTSTQGQTATLRVASAGLYTLTLAMREDGLRVDRLLLISDTNYLPTDQGPPGTPPLAEALRIERQVERVVDYDYDPLYRLTDADYSTGPFGTSELDIGEYGR